MADLTFDERFDRLERIVVQLGEDVAPGTMSNRAIRRREIMDLKAELAERAEAAS